MGAGGMPHDIDRTSTDPTTSAVYMLADHLDAVLAAGEDLVLAQDFPNILARCDPDDMANIVLVGRGGDNDCVSEAELFAQACLEFGAGGSRRIN